MKKLSSLLCLALLAGNSAMAQKIDFNLSGKESTSNEDGYTSWVISRTKDVQSKTIDGITIKAQVATGTGLDCNALNNNWWKDGVNKYSKLLSDALYPIILDASNNYSASSTAPMGVKFTVSGLSAGTHSLCAYHNNTDGVTSPSYPTIKVLVNGEVKQSGVAQSIRAQKIDDAALSYVKFEVKEGESVTIEYISEPAAGVTYINNYVAINGLIFDRPHPKMAVSNPSPAHQDFHADCDASAVLSWTGGSSAVKHHVMLGTAADNMQEVTVTTASTYTITTPLSSLNTYYWRIDEEDAAGNKFEGDVWTFRPRHLAFPGAEGYGRYAIGGRGGVVYHVTSLDDDVNNPAPGTFRYGIKNISGPRTIVFDVSGYITLKGRLTCSDPYVTVAGQTAPGEGITFRGAPLGFASDGITRFIRSYRGYAGTAAGAIEAEQNKGLDGLGMAGCDNAIIDHCSVSWTTDEAFSSRNAHSVTLQRTMLSEALNCADHPNYGAGTCHGYAATIGGGSGYGVGSYHHNLLAHCEGRNWSLSGGLTGGGEYDGAHDVFNNVVYNWGGRATDGGTHQLNFVNNYYKMGPATTQKYLLRHQFEGTGKGSQAAYVSGNIREELTGTKTADAQDDTYRYELSGGQVLSWEPWNATPFFESHATIESAKAAYINVLSDVGCNQPFFNAHDTRMVTETYNRTTSTKGSKTGKQGLIDREWDAEGYTAMEEVSRPADYDSDQDGMPDWWEVLTGTDRNVADNNSDANNDGYTALEDYLNWMAEPHFDMAPSSTGKINLRTYFAGYPAAASFTADASQSGYGVSIAGDVLTVTTGSQDAIVTIPVTASCDDATLTRHFNIHVASAATGVAEVNVELQSASNDNIARNVLGQSVSNSFHGVVIRNGKKYTK